MKTSDSIIIVCIGLFFGRNSNAMNNRSLHDENFLKK
jgi:hypothetical protein